MRVGIIADTHDNVAAVERMTALFREAGVETLLHCGDFVAPPVLPFFEGFSIHGVLGNNDGEVAGLEAGFEAIGGELHGRFAALELGGKRFAMLHGESKAEIEDYAESGEYDYVCYGHHHEREERPVGETTVINPGAHFPTVPDEHRTVAIVDTAADELEFRRV
ncbi:metallophosphoesterase [Halalkalicoccus jeotgali]|uniref:Phosphoesterase n=1 Tax=Halalkalicoccus jeotgali (strain DSM 18796 / CECT 7217 / JCM 14584 / KCTC 4019 / B3) TaxID=795797 RepID=D8J8H0_HALJB|nr:metallophosphoesterase [Halalkalicoccus jeotgali]ADJ16216.1 phosphodiesterase, MJ0936 family protein [Halalkalicoccus jeotgali B3]ELY37290.1 phosphodiesterase [Halalkalicoccus jeotgali B3]